MGLLRMAALGALGFVEATLALALEREDMGPEVRRIAERLLAG